MEATWTEKATVIGLAGEIFAENILKLHGFRNIERPANQREWYDLECIDPQNRPAIIEVKTRSPSATTQFFMIRDTKINRMKVISIARGCEAYFVLINRYGELIVPIDDLLDPTKRPRDVLLSKYNKASIGRRKRKKMSNPFDDKPQIDNLNEDYNDPEINNVHVRLRDKEATHLVEIKKAYRLALAEMLQRDPSTRMKFTHSQIQNLESISRHQMLHYIIQFSFKHRPYLGKLIARMAMEHTTDLDIYEKRHEIDIVSDEYAKRIHSQNYIDFMSMPTQGEVEVDKKSKPKRGKSRGK